MSQLRGDWNYPTTIRFGAGRIAELGPACDEVGLRRPLLVTDKGLAESSMIAHAVSRLRQAGAPLRIFSDIAGDPTGEDVSNGIEALREHQADGVIAFGGGSALDAGKSIAFAAHQSLPLWAFEDIGDNFKLADRSRILPVIAVPTTAGTGSEVGRASVIRDVEAGLKRVIFHPAMMPRVVIADPELTVGMPAGLTAAVGMDALSHNLEAYFRSGVPSLRPWPRHRGRAPGQGLADRGRLRAGQYRREVEHAGRRGSRRDGLSTWVGRDARPGSSARRSLWRSPRTPQRRADAIRGLGQSIRRSRRTPPSWRACLILGGSSDDLLELGA